MVTPKSCWEKTGKYLWQLPTIMENVLNRIQSKWSNFMGLISNFIGLISKQKSVNSNFTLAVHLPKLNHAKTHFLSHHNVCKINRFAKLQTTSDLLIEGSYLGLAIFFLLFSPKWDKKWVLAWLSFAWWVYCQSKVWINWL